MKIGVIGSCMSDFSVFMETFPKPGQTVYASQPLFRSFGGKGGNQAVQAARLGGDVVFVARVGDDELGVKYKESLEREGMSSEYVKLTKGTPTGYASIWIEEGTGENKIVVASGANEKLDKNDVDSAWGEISQCGVLLFQMETPLETTLYALKRAKSELSPRPVTVVNTAPAPLHALPGELFEHCDILCPNETEASVLTGMSSVCTKEQIEQAANDLHLKGAKAVLITLGEMGSYYSSITGEKQFVESVKVSPVVDTTGAGDAFLGGLVYGLGKSMSVMDSILFARRVAAFSVTRKGTQTSFGNFSDVKHL